MCDTIIALQNASEDGSVIFGKNSDREANESHAICYVPRTNHKEGELINAQYITIPQVKETFALILSKPVWLKIGCEMGANEFGVVIGNESVFTKENYEKQGLLGMELLRITLERARTASIALKTITNLIDKYGQGGTGSPTDPNFIYHNSFIITDLDEAWILETANKFWVAQKVHDMASISNGLTIGDKWDLASPNLVENAIEKGWCESKSEFNFADCYSDPNMRNITGCLDRQSKTINNLLDKKGQINIETMMDILRDHGSKQDKDIFNPSKGTMSSVCLHLNNKTVSQTTASYVARLAKDLKVHWLTGTSAPCLSIFKPFFFESPNILKKFKIPSLKNDNESLWWQHEMLHRIALMDYPNRAPLIIDKNKELEQQLIEKVNEIIKNVHLYDKEKLKIKLENISNEALNQNFLLIKNLIGSISNIKIQKTPPKNFTKLWMKLSEDINLKLNV